MRKLFLKIFLFSPLIFNGQDKSQDSINSQSFFVFSGDSIPRNAIPLDEVIIFQPLKFKTYNELVLIVL